MTATRFKCPVCGALASPQPFEVCSDCMSNLKEEISSQAEVVENEYNERDEYDWELYQYKQEQHIS